VSVPGSPWPGRLTAGKLRDDGRAGDSELEAGGRTEHRAEQFGVPGETIHRDLIRLEREGLLNRVYGGAEPTDRSRASEAPSVPGHNPICLGVADMPSALLELVIAGMRGRGRGRAITNTSSGVIEPVANLGLPNLLRVNLARWLKTPDREIAADGATANIVIPGRAAAGRIRFRDQPKKAGIQQPADQIVAASTQSNPIGRYGYPAEFAILRTQNSAIRPSG
jgi:hypothetical protein